MSTRSIVTKHDHYCIFCGRETDEEHHLNGGNADRQIAEIDGLKIPICSYCHTMNEVSRRIHGNPMAQSLSKMLGEMAFIKEYYKNLIREQNSELAEEIEEDAIRKFRERYGKNYL